MRYESKKISNLFLYFLNYSGTKYRNIVIYINYFQIMVIKKTLKKHLIFHILFINFWGETFPNKGFHFKKQIIHFNLVDLRLSNF